MSKMYYYGVGSYRYVINKKRFIVSIKKKTLVWLCISF